MTDIVIDDSPLFNWLINLTPAVDVNGDMIYDQLLKPPLCKFPSEELAVEAVCQFLLLQPDPSKLPPGTFLKIAYERYTLEKLFKVDSHFLPLTVKSSSASEDKIPQVHGHSIFSNRKAVMNPQSNTLYLPLTVSTISKCGVDCVVPPFLIRITTNSVHKKWMCAKLRTNSLPNSVGNFASLHQVKRAFQSTHK